jgi:hypothetical protein
MRFSRGATAGAVLLLVLGACAPGGREGTSDRREPIAEVADSASASAPDQPVSWPPRGGHALTLDDGSHAELIVDDTGMLFVYLFDAAYRPLETEGRHVSVAIVTPDGASRDILLAGMGRGAAAHHMNPMDEAVLAHVREQGVYAAHVTVTSDAGTARGETRVDGVATGGKGM